jgi:pathogenesis-related protein 1
LLRAFVVHTLLAAASVIAQPQESPRNLLQFQNEVRARIGIPPLTWSYTLARHAQDWANTLLARKQFEHSPKSGYGENLFEIVGAGASTARVVDSWASEAKDYDYASNKCRKVCGHYTQIVWASTKEVGCAVARDARREVWVCNYDPPGNWVGKRPY